MASINDPTRLSVQQLSCKIASKQLSSTTVVEAFLARIAEHEDKLQAFTEIYADDARLAAQAADQAIQSGHAAGPLHGVPIAIKDLVEIEGRITTGGCAAWRERRSRYTATLVQRLLAQGMIILGKTHTVEFAMGGWGTNMHMGTPWNPWDPTRARAPGGSSNGSGVAVAARLAPWAVGTDTGGSVRLPASWCGLTSLKVTSGRISTHGVLPLSPTLDTPGPMAYSVDDAALLYQAMRGPDPHDRRTLGLPAANNSTCTRHDITGMRLASLADSERAAVDREVLAAYDRSLDELTNLGADIQPLDLSFSFSDIAQLNGRIMSAESYAILADVVDDPSLPLDEYVRPRIQAGRDISSHAYLTTLATRKQLHRDFETALGDKDAFLTPTTLTTAPTLEAVDETSSPAHFTRFANLLELCALALPNGVDSQGLPTSLQIMGRRYDEDTPLHIGRMYQAATDWHSKRPPE